MYIPNNNKLVADLVRGDKSAFRILFTQCYKELCRFAFFYVNEVTVAEDIIQELLFHVWQNRSQFDVNQNINSYLFVSTRNRCLNYIKGKKNMTTLDAASTFAVDIEEVETEEKYTVLWRAIDKLPMQCGVIFKLIVLEELSYKEVAERMDISINTVKTQMKIAYKTLRANVSQETIYLFISMLRK